ncbi:MAG: EF-hand domain-containing protein [Myxococcaceae bacterium]
MRRFIGKKLGMVLLASAAVAGVSVAATGEGRPVREKVLEKFDANRDGQLDESERQAMREAKRARMEERRQEMLQKFDANRDGQLDQIEREAAQKQRAEARFKKLDADGNGVLSLEEFQAGKAGRHGRHGRR